MAIAEQSKKIFLLLGASHSPLVDDAWVMLGSLPCEVLDSLISGMLGSLTCD